MFLAHSIGVSANAFQIPSKKLSLDPQYTAAGNYDESDEDSCGQQLYLDTSRGGYLLMR